MAIKSDAVWQDINVDSLSAPLRAAYEAYKVAQRAAAELRTEFEQAVNDAAGLPNGHKLVFGYRFGKLSAAMVEDTAKAKGPTKGAATLGDFLKMQANSGARV